jgi:hypothetical protein
MQILQLIILTNSVYLWNHNFSLLPKAKNTRNITSNDSQTNIFPEIGFTLCMFVFGSVINMIKEILYKQKTHCKKSPNSKPY